LLDLSKTRLGHLPIGLSRLEVLRISGNEGLWLLPPGMKRLKSVRLLDAKGCCLQVWLG
jgi:hypothetical protein